MDEQHGRETCLLGSRREIVNPFACKDSAEVAKEDQQPWLLTYYLAEGDVLFAGICRRQEVGHWALPNFVGDLLHIVMFA